MTNAIFNLSAILTSGGGLKLTSSASYFGITVASAGDFNCDGRNGDVLVCANNGPCYLFFSGYFNNSLVVDTSILNGTNGCKLVGPTDNELGAELAIAGNITGNGCSSIMIAASGINTVYVIFPMRYPPAIFNVSNLNASTGLIFVGSANTALGAAVAGDGDVDGDGLTDIAFTTSTYVPSASYVILGKSNFTALAKLGVFNLSSPPVVASIVSIVGPLGLGTDICIGADINKDGFDDIAISLNGDINAVAIAFGNATLPSLINISTLNGANGTLITSSSSYFGENIVPAGTVNGKGYQSLLIGSFAEVAFVLFGQPSFPATLDTSSFNGENGVSLTSSIGGSFGFSGTRAGYTNNNGLNGFLLGTVSTSAIFFFNGRESWPATVDTSSLNCVTGVELLGNSISELGCELANIGDFNGDGTPDFIMGACGTQNAAAIVFGGSFVTCNNTDTPSESKSITASSGTASMTLTSSNALSPYAFPTVVNLLDPSNTNLVKFSAPNSAHSAGFLIASIGDVNNDGTEDFALSTIKEGPCDMYINISLAACTGEFYGVYGQKNISNFQTDLTLVRVPLGFSAINIPEFPASACTGAFATWSSKGFGLEDINEDGISDFAISTPLWPLYEGRATAVFGKDGGVAETLDLVGLNSSGGFVIGTGSIRPNWNLINMSKTPEEILIVNGRARRRVSSMRTFNQGGYFASSLASGNITGSNASIVIGDMWGSKILPGFQAQDVNPEAIGEISVIPSSDAFSAMIDSQALPSGGFKMPIRAAALSVCDVNGDNAQDVVSGSAAFLGQVVYGPIKSNSIMYNPMFDGQDGFTIVGAPSSDLLSIVTGDMNGNKLCDIVIGVPSGQGGSVYIILSKSTFEPQVNVSGAYGSSVFILNGKSNKILGGSIALNDINGDGMQDLMVMAQDSACLNSTLHVFFGRFNFSVYNSNLGAPDGREYFMIINIPGCSPTVAGVDVNGNGRADILISGIQATPEAVAYLIEW